MDKKWWKESIGYQIYPKTFCGIDSKNGTIKGIISKLDYLQELGITLIWINPIYASPMDDNGYDISSYYEINPDYGTYDDVKELIEQAHKRNIKVIFDLVLNHTSDENEWFKKSIKQDAYYSDFYIWLDDIPNWGSFFGGSCFKYNEERKQYFLKLFSDKMPDLNWENPNVLKEMKKIITYLLDLGIDGFRLDAISHIGKAKFEKIEPYDKIVYDYTKYSNLPLVHTILKDLKDTIFSKKDILTVGEIGGPHTVDEALDYTKEELSMIFTFSHIWCNNIYDINNIQDRKIYIRTLNKVIDLYQEKINNQGWIGLYWMNHDHPRLMSQYGDIQNPLYSGSMLACLMYFLKGTPFIYNGEEIGMTNYDFTNIKEFGDVNIRKLYQINVVENKMSEEQFILKHKYTSRDNARTIMQWDDSVNAGFSSKKPDSLVNPNYKEINVKKQLKGKSLLNEYKKIISVRKQNIKTFVYGEYKKNYINDDIISYYRNKHLIICNLTNNEINIDLFIKTISIKNILYSNYENKKIGKILKPYEALVMEVE